MNADYVFVDGKALVAVKGDDVTVLTSDDFVELLAHGITNKVAVLVGEDMEDVVVVAVAKEGKKLDKNVYPIVVSEIKVDEIWKGTYQIRKDGVNIVERVEEVITVAVQVLLNRSSRIINVAFQSNRKEMFLLKQEHCADDCKEVYAIRDLVDVNYDDFD